MNLSEVTMRQMEAGRSTVLEGIILDSPEEMDDISIMIPCFCVHDSEHSPCKCMNDRKIYFERKDLLKDVEQLERESQDEKISRVTIDRDAEVLVEHSTSVSAEEAGRLAEYANIIREWPTDTSPFPTTNWPFPFPNPFPGGEFPPFNGEENVANLIWLPVIVIAILEQMTEVMESPDEWSPTPDGEEDVVYWIPIAAAVAGAVAGAFAKHLLDDNKKCTTETTRKTYTDERGRLVVEEKTVKTCK